MVQRLGEGDFSFDPASNTELEQKRVELDGKIDVVNIKLDGTAKKIDSLASLKMTQNIKENDLFSTLGYYSLGDGGGADYVIKTTALTEDGGSVITLQNGLQAHLIHKGEIFVKWFGAKVDNVTDDTSFVQKAINFVGSLGGELTFPVGTCLITDTLTIPYSAVTIKGMGSGGTNGNATGKFTTIRYDGIFGKELIILGNKTQLSVTPVRIKDLMLDGGNKALWGILANRINALSEFNNLFIMDCIGAMKAVDCWYFNVKDVYVRNRTELDLTGLITTEQWDDVKKGVVQFTAANNCEFSHIHLSYVKIKNNGDYLNSLIDLDRFESCEFYMTSIERCITKEGLVKTGTTSLGNNLVFRHVYLEYNDSDTVFRGGTYDNSNIFIEHVHMLGNHIRRFIYAVSANAAIQYRVKSVDMINENSMEEFGRASVAQSSIVVEDSFLMPGKMIIGIGESTIIEPYNAVAEAGRATYDNRKGLISARYNTSRPFTMDSYVESGLDTITSGNDANGAYVDLLLDGYRAIVNGVPVFLSKKRDGFFYKMRFRPTALGALTTWQCRLSNIGTLYIEVLGTTTNDATSTPIFNFQVGVDNLIVGGSVDTTVRRKPGIFGSYANGGTGIFHRSADPSAGTDTWRRGDIVFNSTPSAGGKIGWVCVTAGKPGVWKAFGAIDA